MRFHVKNNKISVFFSLFHHLCTMSSNYHCSLKGFIVSLNKLNNYLKEATVTLILIFSIMNLIFRVSCVFLWQNIVQNTHIFKNSLFFLVFLQLRTSICCRPLQPHTHSSSHIQRWCHGKTVMHATNLCSPIPVVLNSCIIPPLIRKKKKLLQMCLQNPW